MNGKWITSQNEEDKNVVIKASWGNNEPVIFTYDKTNNYHYINIGSNLKNDDSIENIRIYCYKNETNILFDETIYIINDYDIDYGFEIKNNGGYIVSKFSPEELNNDDENRYANTYTQIDKNGIFIKSKNETDNTITTFCVKNGEILMQVGNYGIKITKEGITQINNDLN
jgi:hypothetical protein